MSDDETLQEKLRKLQASRTGHAKPRERVGVEHRLAHLSNRQEPWARYLGVRKNTFDLRRLAAVRNLETLSRRSNTPTSKVI
jgi:hypothetical protein